MSQITTVDSATLVADYIRSHGPIATARVSSAQSHTQYNYWGCVRYEIRLTADGRLTNVALARASSDRRSERLAHQDCEDMCQSERRIRLQTIGTLSQRDIERLAELIG